MKFELKNAENYKQFFFETPLFFSKKFRISCLFYNAPDAWVNGYSARTETGHYVLFFDYDNLDLSAIEQEIIYLQKRFKLSTFYLFKTDRKDSFHAVCLDTFPLAEAYEILKQSSSDAAFIHAIKNLASKEWILRVGKKGDRRAPEFLKAIVRFNDGDKHVKSSAHKAFLIKLGLPECFFTGKRWDGCRKLGLVRYNTANRTIK